MNEVKPILCGQIYAAIMKIGKPEGMTQEEFSSNYEDFIDKFENLFDECMMVVATSFQAICAVKSLLLDSLFGTIPIQDKVETLNGYIEEFDPKGEVLANNLHSCFPLWLLKLPNKIYTA